MRAGKLLRAALAAAAAAATPAVAAPDNQASEAAVKAAFVPKFTRYIQLPPAMQPATGQPYYLCVIGRDPFGALIDRAAASEVIDGHPVAVRRFASTDPAAVAGCHLAFVAGSSEQATTRMLDALKRQATLTITDARGGKPRGMIHFVIEQGRVRFYIDLTGAGERGITVSSRLLALAVEVRGAGQ